MIKLFYLACIVLMSPFVVQSQTFTKVTDPANPIAADRVNSGGGCWADFNNDGFLDLFVANGNDSSQNNSLYLNNRSGSFIKVVTGNIVNDGGTSIGGTSGDYNNDGKLDLFVTNRLFTTAFGNFFYRGNGDSTFTKITTGGPATDVANSNSSSWVDINGDGSLDLFVVNFQGNNFLYYNSGSPAYTFTRVDSGEIVLDGSGASIVGVWADYNNDRKPDLFIGNGGTQNDLLFTNTGNGGFTRTQFSDGRAALGASWGDYDNDGNLDLFVANYLNQNNILYHNSGPPSYTLVRIDTGIVSNDGGSSVGSVWGDFDNDGDLDLFVCNDGQNNALYLNSGPPNYAFSKVTSGVVVNDGGNSFGCAAADYDNNGSLDLFVANRLGRQNFLYSNNGSTNRWINLRCVGTTSNRTGIGAKVRIRATISGSPRWQMQEVTAQSGYNSQTLRLHFGLGNATVIDSVRIEWPSGATETFTNLPTNTNTTFTEGSGPTGIGAINVTSPVEFRLEQNYPNPFNPITTFEFRVAEYGHVRLKVFDLVGNEVITLVDGLTQPGTYTLLWDASGISSGVYFYTLTSRDRSLTKKLILLK